MNQLFKPEDDAVGRIYDQLTHLAKINSAMPPVVGSVETLTREQISVLVEEAFWSSLRCNEGRRTRVWVTVVTPENFHDAAAFATTVPYDEAQIVKLAAAASRDGCLVVCGSVDGLRIWGLGRSRPGSRVDTVTIEVSQPGVVRVGVGLFQTFAVFNGRIVSMIEGTRTLLPAHLQGVLRKTLPTDDFIETQAVWRECMALADLARMILYDGHGGTVLIVGSEMGGCLESLSSFAYRFATPDTTIRDAVRAELKDGVARGEILQRLWATSMSDADKQLITGALTPRPGETGRGVRVIASLAAVDGAIVMTSDLRVMGFGAKIAVGSDAAPQVCMFRPEPGSQKVVESRLEELGGTRHQSAARFVAANKDAVALVISQDRHMSLMHWDESLGLVSVIRNAEWWV